jgi:hypothetical protein
VALPYNCQSFQDTCRRRDGAAGHQRQRKGTAPRLFTQYSSGRRIVTDLSASVMTHSRTLGKVLCTLRSRTPRFSPEFARLLACFLKSGQRSGCGDDLSEGKQCCFCCGFHDRNAPCWIWAMVPSEEPRRRWNISPSWRGKAPVRPRRQGRDLCVHRSEAESLDGRSGRIRRRV